MNPKNAVYLRAQAAILGSSGVSVRETAKILQKKQELGSEVVLKVHKSFTRSQEVVDHQSLTEWQRKL